VGYNARFDADFIRSFFEKCGDQYFGSWFWFPPIDVMNLALIKLMDKRATMPNFKLATVANVLGLEPEGRLHEAHADIRLTQQIFNNLTGGQDGNVETTINR
jgi:DNA polymerase III epsilon subunit-like protein